MVAGRQAIDPILPVPPVAGSLLQSVSAVPGDWRTGIEFTSRAWNQAQWAWPDCVPDWEDCYESITAKPVGLPADDGDSGTPAPGPATYPSCQRIGFDPWTVYTTISEVSVQPDEARRLTAQAQAVHEAYLSATVARTISGYGDGYVYGHDNHGPFCTGEVSDIGDLDSLNPTFETAAGEPVSGDCDPIGSLGRLLEVYTELGGRSLGGAMIHVDVATLPHLVKTGLVAQVGQRYVAAGGVTVVADAGYEFGGGVGVGHVHKMFITGPVEVSTGPVVTIPGSETDNSRLNLWALLLEQRVIYRFDPRMVFMINTQLCCDCFGA